MNLKQAARRLGVHYQTAYRYVRSGRLAAVRVGATYEIAEHAIEQFIAQTEAAQRSPRVLEQPESLAALGTRGLLHDARAAYSAMALSPAGVFDVVADGLARGLGDLVVVRAVSDMGCLVPCAVRHADPRRLSVAWTQVETLARTASEHQERVALAVRKPVLIRHVPQDQLRSQTPPELLQYLDALGSHSLLCVPACHDGVVRAVITLSRDLPSRPYTTDDLAVVARLATIVGAAVARSGAAQSAWRRRRSLMASLGELGDDATDRKYVQDLFAEDGSAEIVCDTDGRVVCANCVAGAIGEIDVEHLVGLSLDDLVIDGEKDGERDLLARLFVGELSYADAPRTVVTETGAQVRMAVHRGVVRNAAAEPRALVVVATPIPEPESCVRSYPSAG